MIEGHVIEEELLLMNEDFPEYFINRAHPSDYLLTNNPVITEFIFHRKQYHNRLIIRISWKVGDLYVPISFVLDTGAPNGFYLSEQARKCLLPRIEMDDLDNEYIVIKNTENKSKKIIVSPVPSNHAPANIMGLKALMFFGLVLREDSISFLYLPEFF
jgi:hypothetical protein